MRNEFRNLNFVLIGLLSVLLCSQPAVCLGQTPAKGLKVLIDPGHGGEDSGSTGSLGVSEKDVTLALGRKLVEVLETSEAISPELIRTDDYSISLDQRAGLANHRQGELLISLHLGTTFTAIPTGFSIYY